MKRPFAEIYIWLVAAFVTLIIVLTGFLVGSLWILKKIVEVI